MSNSISLFIQHKSFNFTESDYKSAKMRDKLSCTCEQCGKQFMRFKRDIKNVVLGIKKGIFCSSFCYKQKQISSIKTNCTQCGKEITIQRHIYEKSTSKHFFCSHSCSASFTNTKRNIANRHKTKTSNAKEEKYVQRQCKICGQNKCEFPEICKSKFFHITTNLEKIGFDVNSIGSKDVYQEYYRIQKQIFDLYHIEQLSMLDIQKIYEIKSERTLELLFKFLNIETRSFSDAQVLVILNGKSEIPNNYNFKCGWHISWENKQFFYRSSYELDYMKELDRKNISYESEIFRIPYFNKFKNNWNIAIPDIYLPDTKTIVEIKSEYTYNKQEMIDKSDEYKRLGFNFKLILDHIEYDYCI